MSDILIPPVGMRGKLREAIEMEKLMDSAERAVDAAEAAMNAAFAARDGLINKLAALAVEWKITDYEDDCRQLDYEKAASQLLKVIGVTLCHYCSGSGRQCSLADDEGYSRSCEWCRGTGRKP